MNGILCIDKPQTFTSFDVIGKLRGILHQKRLGHTGTLDPMATGVLPILVGTATKACDILPNQDKVYRARVQFGQETDTQDIWGTLLQTYPRQHVTRAQLEAALPAFQGTIEQLPPMYSAVSVGGQRLYDLARRGVEVERPRRQVTIYGILLEEFSEPEQTAVLTVSCGKGTYIRTLLSDLGKALGGGGVLTALRRTQACGFSLSQTCTFEQVEEWMREGTLEAHLTETDALFAALPALHLSPAQARMYRNGVKLDLKRLRGAASESERFRVYDESAQFLGIARADWNEGLLRVFKNF